MDEILTFGPGLALTWVVLALGMAAPGPAIAALLGLSLQKGRRMGLAMAAGLAAGSTTWALLTVLGLSALILASATALAWLKIVGGAYLLWLAAKAFRSAATPRPVVAEPEAPALADGARAFWYGYLVQMTNPKAALGWAAAAALAMRPDAPIWVSVGVVLGALALSILINGGYALAFSTSRLARLYQRARRGVEAALGAAFAAAGAALLTSRS